MPAMPYKWRSHSWLRSLSLPTGMLHLSAHLSAVRC